MGGSRVWDVALPLSTYTWHCGVYNTLPSSREVWMGLDVVHSCTPQLLAQSLNPHGCCMSWCSHSHPQGNSLPEAAELHTGLCQDLLCSSLQCQGGGDQLQVASP